MQINLTFNEYLKSCKDMGHIIEDDDEVLNWWYFTECTRDSDILTESNWEYIIETFDSLDIEYTIIRFGHWACGWIDYLVVNPTEEAKAQMQEIFKSYEGYPVLDEDRFSEKEEEYAEFYWTECMDVEERLEFMREDYEFQETRKDYELSDLLSLARGTTYPFGMSTLREKAY